MKQMNIWKRMSALLLTCVLLSGLWVGAWAEVNDEGVGSLDLDQPCKFQISFPMEFSSGEFPHPENLVIDLYYIGGAVQAGKNSFKIEPTGAFAEVDIDSYATPAALAQKLMEIVVNGAQPQDYRRLESDQNIVDFGAVSAGMYLIVAHEDTEFPEDYFYIYEEDGTIVTTALADGGAVEYKFSPKLVTLPSYVGEVKDEEVKDGVHSLFQYNVTQYLKPEPGPRVPDITIQKEDATTHEALPGAKFKLYCALPPEGGTADTIEVYVEGMGMVTLYRWEATGMYADELGQYVSGRSGKIKMEKPDVPPYTLFALVETEAPDGYKLPDDPFCFYLEDLTDGSVEALGGDRQFVNGDAWNGEGLTCEDRGNEKLFTFTVPGEEDVFVKVQVAANCDFQVVENGLYYGGDGYYYYTEPQISGTELQLFVNMPSYDGFEAPELFNVAVSFEIAPMVEGELGEWTVPLDPVDYTSVAKILPREDAGNEYSDYGPLVAPNSADAPTELPEVGGMGTAPYIAGGVGLLFIGALTPLALRKRRTEK